MGDSAAVCTEKYRQFRSLCLDAESSVDCSSSSELVVALWSFFFRKGKLSSFAGQEEQGIRTKRQRTLKKEITWFSAFTRNNKTY